MITPITFVVPTYNNLRYLKGAYKSIRKYAGEEHEVIVLDDHSSDGTLEWLMEQDDPNLVIWENPNEERLGHTILYNVGVDMATNNIFTILHADMFIGPGYVENLLKHLNNGTVVSATRIEPPLHPVGKEKIVEDFGMWPEEFLESKFVKRVKELQKKHSGETTQGIFAPWAMYCEDFLSIGGHDPVFAPFPFEDSDIFQRFILAGYEIVQSRDSFVYHLTCRGHKLTDDKDLTKVDDYYETAQRKAAVNWWRKWNHWIENDEYSYPILYPLYNVAINLHNARSLGLDQIKAVEILGQHISLDDADLADRYIDREQKETLFDMSDRVSITQPYLENLRDFDVIVHMDGTMLSQDQLQALSKLNEVLYSIQESTEDDDVSGTYNLAGLRVDVFDLEDLKTDLIKCERSHRDIVKE